MATQRPIKNEFRKPLNFNMLYNANFTTQNLKIFTFRCNFCIQLHDDIIFI